MKMVKIVEHCQWKLTEDGLESAGQPSENFIEMGRVPQLTTRDGVEYYLWPVHMAEKSWVNIEDFLITFVRALEAYEESKGAPINQTTLANSFSKARELAGQRPIPNKLKVCLDLLDG